jgi:small-conductance mechanosensitive channel
MEAFRIQIIESLLVLAGYLITHYTTRVFINNTLKQTHLQRGRRKIIVKAVHLFSMITASILLAAVWGLEQKEIAMFVGTILTALGIAFFAQWSLLSNITSSLLLFFNHPIKIGDYIRVMDKDYPFEGEVSDLTYFFIILKTKQGDVITIPNAQLFQKSVSIVENINKS